MSEADDELEDVPAPPPKKSKVIPLVLVANTLLLAGVMVFVMKKQSPASAAPAAHEEAKAEEHGAAAESESGGEHGGAGMPGPTVKLDNFIIQLRTVETESRYVRVGFDLELGAENDKNVLSARMAPVRDSIISYFADRSLEELRGSDGMEQTKVNILKRLETIVPGHRIKAIYITDFVVQ